MIVNEAKPRVKEITLEQARERLRQNPSAVLMDVREDTEWQNGRARCADRQIRLPGPYSVCYVTDP